MTDVWVSTALCDGTYPVITAFADKRSACLAVMRAYPQHSSDLARFAMGRGIQYSIWSSDLYLEIARLPVWRDL